MLKSVGPDIKVMQQLLRHGSVRCTLDTYTQAIMPAKRPAQNTVLSMILTAKPQNPVMVAPFYTPIGLAEKPVSVYLEWRGRRDSKPRRLP